MKIDNQLKKLIKDTTKSFDNIKLGKPISKGSFKPFGDTDKDGIKNIMDCNPLDPNKQDARALFPHIDGLGMTIFWPDGREIKSMRENPQEFSGYAAQLGQTIGLRPVGQMQSSYQWNPSRIEIRWGITQQAY
jgi:hypothetical protein